MSPLWRARLGRFGDDPRVPWFLGGAQAAFAIGAVVDDRFLNNEGIFTWIFARMFTDAPITVLFFLKARPPLAAFYALPSALGFEAFAIAHALVAALSVPLTAAIARGVGQPRPNVAAALVFASAVALASGAAGVGNSDGMTLCALSAALLVAWKRPATAGVVAALLPMARAETSMLVLGIAVCVGFRGRTARRRFFAGLVGAATTFALVGALYHGDPLWFLHYPPHVMHAVPAREVMGREVYGGAPHQVTLNLLALLPALGLLPFVRPSAVSLGERAMIGSAIAFAVVLSILPSTAAFNFNDAPRYLLPSLPFLALGINRAIGSLTSSEPVPRRTWAFGVCWLLVLLVAGHFQDADHDAPALLWAVLATSLVVALAASRAAASIPVVVLVLSVAAVPVLLPATRLSNPEPGILGRALLAEADPSVVVLTNLSELPLWVARNGGGDLDVRHMIAADQLYELDALSNAEVGQRARLHALLRDHWYGPVVLPQEISALVDPGTWLALSDDERTMHILDEAALRERVDIVDLDRGLRILKVTEP